jgi:hypothetical protein
VIHNRQENPKNTFGMLDAGRSWAVPCGRNTWRSLRTGNSGLGNDWLRLGSPLMFYPWDGRLFWQQTQGARLSSVWTLSDKLGGILDLEASGGPYLRQFSNKTTTSKLWHGPCRTYDRLYNRIIVALLLPPPSPEGATVEYALRVPGRDIHNTLYC